MNVGNYMIIIIVVSSLMIGMGSFHGGLATNYDLANLTSSAYMNRTTEIDTAIVAMNEDASDISSSGNDAYDKVVNSVAAATRVVDVGKSFTELGGGIMNDFSKDAPDIPSWVGVMIGAIVGLIFVLAIVYVITKVKVW